jgi:hypothetical protein
MDKSNMEPNGGRLLIDPVVSPHPTTPNLLWPRSSLNTDSGAIAFYLGSLATKGLIGTLSCSNQLPKLLP